MGGGGEVSVLVTEQLIRNFAGQQHTDISVLMDVLAHQIHANRSTDGGDIPGAQHGDNFFQRVQHNFLVDDDLGVVGVQVIRHLLGVLQVNGVLAHANGKGAYGLAQLFGGNGTHQAGIQAAGKQEAHRSVGIQPLIHTGHQLFADLGQGGVHIIGVVSGGIGNIAVAHKLAVAVIVADGERIDLFAQADQVLGLGSKGDVAGFAITIEQRADTDGVTRSDQPFFAAVVQNHGELGIQMIEHIQAVLVIQRQDDLAVRIRLKGVAISFQLFFDRAEAIQFAVADNTVVAAEEGLHAFRGQTHNGQTAKAQQAKLSFCHTLVIRPAGSSTHQQFGKFFFGQIMSGIP